MALLDNFGSFLPESQVKFLIRKFKWYELINKFLLEKQPKCDILWHSGENRRLVDASLFEGKT